MGRKRSQSHAATKRSMRRWAGTLEGNRPSPVKEPRPGRRRLTKVTKSMPQPETTRIAAFSELASDLAAACAEAIEANRLDEIPDDSLGQVFGAIVRLYAAKA